MNVRSPKQWDTKHGVTDQYVDMFFCFGFLQKFDVCMIGKNYCIVYLYTKTSQIDCFRLVHKILRWIGSSGLKLHILNTLFKSSSLALTYLTQEKKLYVSSIIQLWRSFVCKILRVLSPWEKYSVGWFLFISLICDIIFCEKV